MMNLALMNKLKMADTVTMHLRSEKDGTLTYYIVSMSVGSEVVCFGRMDGEMSVPAISFNIRLASIIPLINKGYKFEVSYKNGELLFGTADSKVKIKPLYVECRDERAEQTIARLIDFSEALNSISATEERRANLVEELNSLKRKMRLEVMDRVATPFSDINAFYGGDGPFGDPESTRDIEQKYQPLIEKQEEMLSQLDVQSSMLKPVDMSGFKSLALAAGRTHGLVDFCESYGIVCLKNSFLLQKGPCPIQSLSGILLQTLIQDGDGQGFYSFKGDLVYLTGKEDKTVVFISKYLPNNAVDSSIVTKGVVEEKYSIQLRGILDIAPLVRSKFKTFKMDMGNGLFILENELGESITYNFDTMDAQTVALAKLNRGVGDPSKVVLSTIVIPAEVQPLLNLFRRELTVYIKKRKIVFQCGTLYLVFGR